MSNHGTQDKPAINTHSRRELRRSWQPVTSARPIPPAISNKYTLQQHLPVSCVGGPPEKPLRWRVVRSYPATTSFQGILLQALEVHHTFVPHVSHNSMCPPPQHMVAGDIVAPEDEPEEDVAEDEGENGLETVRGAPWHDQLSAEVSGLEEVPPDHNYL
ncbi:hypothetical protein N1851_015764 [Merluccius polli]|uniref:Uncharacterized protein n=1 Tax=Merluccius polli TaxID=89951 RepID=A0AA47MRJ7_MERPO|nr:hypothetical protein N1851_015764 [Merluccius polli]